MPKYATFKRPMPVHRGRDNRQFGAPGAPPNPKGLKPAPSKRGKPQPKDRFGLPSPGKPKPS